METEAWKTSYKRMQKKGEKKISGPEGKKAGPQAYLLPNSTSLRNQVKINNDGFKRKKGVVIM